MSKVVLFEDYSIRCKEALNEAGIAFLAEAGGEVASMTARNQTRVASGQTKGAWDYIVDEAAQSVTIGNPEQNSIWEEFGTGEYALYGNGRKGGWKYEDEDGWHATRGKPPLRAFYKAYNSLQSKIVARAKEIFAERMGK